MKLVVDEIGSRNAAREAIYTLYSTSFIAATIQITSMLLLLREP